MMVLGHSLASVGVEWFGCEYIYALAAGAWLALKVIFAVALGIKGFPSHALALAGRGLAVPCMHCLYF